MKKEMIVSATEEFVKKEMGDEPTGHDWWHVDRVRNMALHIAKSMNDNLTGADIFTLELSALLHDIADWKFHGGDEEAGPKAARKWLESLGDVDIQIISDVCDIIKGITFKGAGVVGAPLSLAGQIVQDADRLDALGAIGIARAFAYGGYKKQQIHTPAIAPSLHTSSEEYKQRQSSTINHFHEKLLLLKDRMNTGIAKEIAEKRHEQMLSFLNEFNQEWDFK